MNPDLTITLSEDMLLKVFKHMLDRTVEHCNQEIAYPNCHPEDAEDCRKMIAAVRELYVYYFGEEDL